jgi:hypothetical protein
VLVVPATFDYFILFGIVQNLVAPFGSLLEVILQASNGTTSPVRCLCLKNDVKKLALSKLV